MLKLRAQMYRKWSRFLELSLPHRRSVLVQPKLLCSVVLAVTSLATIRLNRVLKALCCRANAKGVLFWLISFNFFVQKSSWSHATLSPWSLLHVARQMRMRWFPDVEVARESGGCSTRWNATTHAALCWQVIGFIDILDVFALDIWLIALRLAIVCASLEFFQSRKFSTKYERFYEWRLIQSFLQGSKANDKTTALIRTPYLRVLGIEIQNSGPGRSDQVQFTPEEERKFKWLVKP